MPETVLPPPSIASAGNAPRIGTAANDTSWAGWAISSFTNKLTAASGEIQSGTNGTPTSQQRPSSVPPLSSEKTNKPALSNTRSGMTLQKSSASIPSIMSPNPASTFEDADADFDDGWGGFEDPDAKPDAELDPWASPAPTPSSTSKAFDDQGEPDFAGWLAAQSATKKTVKSPLPKGLTKAATTKSARPTVGSRTSTTGSVTTKKVATQPKKEVPKVEAKREDEEEGWGDAW